MHSAISCTLNQLHTFCFSFYGHFLSCINNFISINYVPLALTCNDLIKFICYAVNNVKKMTHSYCSCTQDWNALSCTLINVNNLNRRHSRFSCTYSNYSTNWWVKFLIYIYMATHYSFLLKKTLKEKISKWCWKLMRTNHSTPPNKYYTKFVAHNHIWAYAIISKAN